MARQKFQHKQLVESRQPSPNKSIYPGMIIEFRYKAENIFDKQPMVLVLWNDLSAVRNFPSKKCFGKVVKKLFLENYN